MNSWEKFKLWLAWEWEKYAHVPNRPYYKKEFSDGSVGYIIPVSREKTLKRWNDLESFLLSRDVNLKKSANELTFILTVRCLYCSLYPPILQTLSERIILLIPPINGTGDIPDWDEIAKSISDLFIEN